MKRVTIQIALQRIQRANGGLLRPEDVVSEARAKISPLHPMFEWKDSAAAHEYRLWQARQLIRVSVIFLPNGSDQAIKAFVSMLDDRTQDGGGYRALVDVLSDKTMRQAFLKEALAELQVFERKYQMLSELAVVFAAMKRVRKPTKTPVAQQA
jgi:hypothetical protein